MSCNHVIIQSIHNHEDALLDLWALLDASSHLSKRDCPSVAPLVHPLVRPSVMRFFQKWGITLKKVKRTHVLISWPNLFFYRGTNGRTMTITTTMTMTTTITTTTTTIVEAEAAMINNNHERMMAQMMEASEKRRVTIGWMDRWLDKQKDEWADRQMDDWTN